MNLFSIRFFHVKKTGDLTEKKLTFFSYLLLIEAILIISFLVSALIINIAKIGSEPDFSPQPREYRFLYKHYGVLSDFLQLPVTPLTIELPVPPVKIRLKGKSNAPLNDTPPSIKPQDIENPFIRDIALLKQVEAFLSQDRPEEAELILSKMDSPDHHPFIQVKRERFHLRYLFSTKNYDEYITGWEKQNPPGAESKIMLIHSLIKIGNEEKAFEHFKTLFARQPLGLFEVYIPKPVLLKFFSRLDYDFWLKKYKYLSQNNRFSEFLVERKNAATPQLNEYFLAEFVYNARRYEECSNILKKVTHELLKGYKLALLLKIDIRKEKYEGLENRLDELYSTGEGDLYRQTLLDTAGLLLSKGESDLALTVFKRYLRIVDLYHKFVTEIGIPGVGQTAPIQTRNFRDSEYWRALWTAAWIFYQKNDYSRSIAFFKLGMDSPIPDYRAANIYWYHRLRKLPPPSMDHYAFTYYYMRSISLDNESPVSSSLKPFITMMNQPMSRGFLPLLNPLNELMKNGFYEEGVEYIRWLIHHHGHKMAISDKYLLKLMISITYLKKGDYATAYFRFKENFGIYQTYRLPRFLSKICLPVKYGEIVKRWADELKLESGLIFSLIREESFFRTDAVSPADAYGLMQLLLPTARQMARPYEIKLEKTDLFNAETNIRFGIEYLKYLLDRYDGKFYLALAAYNAGQSRVDAWLKRFSNYSEDEFIEMIPFTATRNYVKNILRNYFYYRMYYDN